MCTDESGEFHIDGIPTGIYGLSARTDDGKFAVVSHFKLGESGLSPELVMSVSPGAVLRLIRHGQVGTVLVGIIKDGVPICQEELLAGDASIEKQVPAGVLEIMTHPESDTSSQLRTARLAPGEYQEISL